MILASALRFNARRSPSLVVTEGLAFKQKTEVQIVKLHSFLKEEGTSQGYKKWNMILAVIFIALLHAASCMSGSDTGYLTFIDSLSAPLKL